MTADQIQAQIDVVNAKIVLLGKQYALQGIVLSSELTKLQAQLASLNG